MQKKEKEEKNKRIYARMNDNKYVGRVVEGILATAGDDSMTRG